MSKKIGCIGSNLESFKSLQYLVQNGCTIDVLITLPAGEAKNVSDYVDLHPFCVEHGIYVVDTKNVNSEATIATLQQLRLDYLFTLGWSQIFKKDFINCFSGFVVGTHPTKLPYGRGRAPLPWTILEDLRESAVSFFKIDTGVDTGKLIMQRNFDITPRAYVGEVYEQVAAELGKGFLEIYLLITKGEAIPAEEQNEEGATVRGKRTPADGFINFNATTDEIDRLIRAVSEPYPGAYCYYKDEKIVFWEVEKAPNSTYYGTLGQIHKRKNDGILVQFKDGNLWLQKPTFENVAPVDLKFFRVGDKLGFNIEDEIYKLKKQQNA